ncbi:hypothetical protein AAG906_001733 [Vitis piasezkii]
MINHIIVLSAFCDRPHLSFKVCKERTMEKRKTGDTAAVFLRTFGALTEVHFLHSIYHFKAQEVNNPKIQTMYDLELK